jgi:sigma-B regulation protein RsbU (phosphoserine phosphatase)
VPRRAFEIRLPAEPASLRVVRAFVHGILEDVLGDDVADVVLAVDEACANIIQHRARIEGRDDIDLRVEVEPTCVRFLVACFCIKRDLPRIRPRDLADQRPGGIGTRLIGEIMDRIDYEPCPEVPGTMTLVLEKQLGPSLRP